jgi:hypothetical protein
MTPIQRYDHHDPAIIATIADLDDDEARDKLERAVRILRDYPKGQSDGVWIQHRQWFLENFLPEEECK